MNVTTTVNDGYNITKKGWFTQSVFAIIFSFIFGLVVIPFAFFVAIATALRGDYTATSSGPVITNFNQFIDDISANPIFWFSIYLLLLVGLTFICILIGMLQFIGTKKYSSNGLSLEEYLKYPFKNGRIYAFILLAFLESIVSILVGGILTIFREALDLNKTVTVNSISDVIDNFLTWQNILYLVVSLIVFLILFPPLLISCFAIVHDETKFNSFFFGWKKYLKSIIYFEEITVVSLIPMGVVVVLLSLIGLGITSVTGFETSTTTTSTNLSASDLSMVLGLSFVIIVLAFITILFLLPLLLNTIGKSYEEKHE